MRTIAYIFIFCLQTSVAYYWGLNDNTFLCVLFSIFAGMMLSGMIGHLAGKWLKSNDSEPTEAEKIKHRLEALGYKDIEIKEVNGRQEVHYKIPNVDLKQFLN